MRFVDERGLAWTMAEFCEHYRIALSVGAKMYASIGKPDVIDTRIFAASCRPLAKIKYSIVLRMPYGRNEIFTSWRRMSEFIEVRARRNQRSDKRCGRRFYLRRWTRMGRPGIVDLEALFNTKTLPSRDVPRVPHIKLTPEQAKLAAIPGPTLYETMHLNDAGKFGAASVPRENFAGRMQGGAPIYTGR